MKAWIAGPRGYGGFIALVYADTRNQARALLVGFYDSDDEYVDMEARRCPKMDGKHDKRGVCEVEALQIESGEFWMCEDHQRLTDEDRMCPDCRAERKDAQ